MTSPHIYISIEYYLRWRHSLLHPEQLDLSLQAKNLHTLIATTMATTIATTPTIISCQSIVVLPLGVKQIVML